MLPGAMRDEKQKKAVAVDPEVASPELEDEDLTDDLLFRDALESYRTETLAWAERRSATMAPPHARGAAASWRSVPRRALAAAALTVVVAAAAIQHHRAAEAIARANSFVRPSPQTLASDNLLLSSVGAALSEDITPTEQELGLTKASVETWKARDATHGRMTRHAR